MTELKLDTPEAQVAHIMATFDFQKVHRVMEILNWKWAMPERDVMTRRFESRVPTIGMMRDGAWSLLNYVVRAAKVGTQEASAGTGGFYAILSNGNRIELLFVLEEASGTYAD